jgi:NifU-like protein involved in Fe-S cluster formation
MNAPLYTLEILRLAASLPEPVKLERVDGSAELRSPTCGSTVRTEVQLSSGCIEAISQQVQACAFGQASAALIARQASGRGREDIAVALDQLSAWLSGESEQLPDWPGIEALAPARSRRSRHGAILLPFRALLAAFDGAVTGSHRLHNRL